MFNASVEKLTLHFKQPAGTSRGVLQQKTSWIIKLWHQNNPAFKGIGECSILPNLSLDDRPSLEQKINKTIHAINQGKLPEELDLDGFPALSFGIEMAMQHLKTGKPNVYFPSPFTEGSEGIPINGLIWMGNTDFMIEQIEKKINKGFKCLKMKIGAISFNEELDVIQLIRQSFKQNQLELRVDANGAFPPDEAMHKIEQLAKYQIHSIEQPIKPGQWQKMNQLCRQSPIPIALDEELIGSRPHLLDVLNPQIIILKPSLTGGFNNSEQWIEKAKQYGIDWWITSALESNIGLNAIAQWTYNLNKNGYHGLGTGQLFTNNPESPLYLNGEKLRFRP